jgi:hypothetical protein
VAPQPAAVDRADANLIERAQARAEGGEAARTPHEMPATAVRYELPPDMVMIETAPEKRRAAPLEPVATSTPPEAPRRPRRVAPAAAPDEPLVQVETRK